MFSDWHREKNWFGRTDKWIFPHLKQNKLDLVGNNDKSQFAENNNFRFTEFHHADKFAVCFFN